MSLAFEGEDVGADTVQKETIMADNDGAACEIDKRIFEGTQGFNIEVVGWLIELKHVATFFQ